MLRTNDLCISAGNFAVDNITLSVPNGSCHVLLGGTGNGKTLILESIAGLRSIKSGQIWIEDYDVTNEAPENRLISYVPQDLALFPHLNVEKNIFYSQRFKKTGIRTSQEINELIQDLHLENILHRLILNLSGGERQRVALARAFATGNKVLLLDEPFSALHYTMKRALWDLLSAMQEKYHLSILLVTHDLEEASFLADHISVLCEGKILQSGPKEEIFYNPNSIEVSKITGHYNYFSAQVLSITSEDCLVYCSVLNCSFHAKNPGIKAGDEIVMAIRSNDIDIICVNSNENSDEYNKVSCQIKKIYDINHSQQFILMPDKQPGSRNSEIMIDIAKVRGVRGFYIGQKVISFFPHDSILIYKE